MTHRVRRVCVNVHRIDGNEQPIGVKKRAIYSQKGPIFGRGAEKGSRGDSAEKEGNVVIARPE